VPVFYSLFDDAKSTSTWRSISGGIGRIFSIFKISRSRAQTEVPDERGSE
jgi:hypothetical protein